MTIDEFCRKAILVPFKPKGRSWDEWDCWGVICLAFKEIKNILLPTYTEYKSIKDREELQTLFTEGSVPEEHWEKVEDPRPMDVAILYMYGRACHIGLVIDKNKMIHCEHGINTVIEPISNYRVEGYYRYAE